MEWYYAAGNERKGPVTEQELDRLVAAGVVGAGTLVWNATLKDWAPHGQVRPGAVSQTGSGIPAVAGQERCSECHKPFAADELLAVSGVKICAGCKPVYLQRIREGALSSKGENIYRSGKELIIPLEVDLPDQCVHCGGASDGRRVSRKLYWHAPWIYVLILVSLLIYIIVAMVVRKKAVVRFSVCAEHRKARNLWVAAGWASFLLMIFSFFSLGLGAPGWVWVWGLSSFGSLILLFVAAQKSRYLWLSKVYKDEARLRGVRKGFLEQFPEWLGGD